jgi:hypothetical protein
MLAARQLAESYSLILLATFSLYPVQNPKSHSFLPFLSSIFVIAMAQVEPSSVPATVGHSPSSLPVSDQLSNVVATLPTAEATQAGTSSKQQIYESPNTETGAKFPVGDDDDVQFVFAVPRRKKKKRKRYDLWNSQLGGAHYFTEWKISILQTVSVKYRGTFHSLAFPRHLRIPHRQTHFGEAQQV